VVAAVEAAEEEAAEEEAAGEMDEDGADKDGSEAHIDAGDDDDDVDDPVQRAAAKAIAAATAAATAAENAAAIAVAAAAAAASGGYVASAASTLEAEAAIDALESATGIDLDGDGVVGGDEAAVPTDGPLPSLPVAPDVPLPSYPARHGHAARVRSLQNEQRSLVASMPLQRPERVVQLLVEKDDALRALTLAQTHQQRLPPPRQGPGWRDEDGPEVGSVDDQYQWGAAGQAVVWPAPGDGDTGIDAMRQLIEEQRQAYERSMRALAAELSQQHVGDRNVEAIEQISVSLQSALQRALELELRQMQHSEALSAATRKLTRRNTGTFTTGPQKDKAKKSSICTIS
jgi:hypothetical protein